MALRSVLSCSRVLYSRVFLCAQRVLFASHIEKLAISVRAPFFERSVFYSRDNLKTRDLYSRIFLCAQRVLFASHSEKLAISVRAPQFFERSVFYSRDNLKTRDLYSRVFLCAQRVLFANHSEKLAISVRAAFCECCVLFFLSVSDGTYQL